MAKKKKKYLLNGFLGLLILAFLVSYGYLIYAYFDKPVQLTDEEVQTTIDSVSKLIKVDADQEPLVATIQDAKALAEEQEFYAPAKNGDILVVYQDKAIIFRPEENILINVGPVYIQNTAFNIDLRNGTGVSGEANAMKAELETASHTVSRVANAAASNYTGTIIVNPNNLDVTALQQQYDATVVAEMPEGEAATTADIVIIKGK